MTESAQGNTHSASLLGAHEFEPEYSVDTMLVTKAGLNMSVGSTIFRPSGVPRGLRMLWFIIGKSAIINFMINTIDCLASLPTGNTTTARSTSANTDRYTTVSPISDSTMSSKLVHFLII